MEITNEPTPTSTTPMKIEINLPEALFNPLVQAIDRLTEAVKANGLVTPPTYSGPLTGTCDSATTTVVESTTEADKPKRGRKPKEPEVAPAVVEPVIETSDTPSVVIATEDLPPVEAPAAAPVPTGPELAAKAGPLAAHPDLQRELINFKANELKINCSIKNVTDAEQLRIFNTKLDELLAKIPTEV